MENFAQVDPLVPNVYCGAESSHEFLHSNVFVGDTTIAYFSRAPFDQAGVSSFELGEIAHVLPSPNSSHSSERDNAADGGVVQMEGPCHRFSLDVVKNATNDFDDKLVVGKGGFGKVYKGSINDGDTTTVVAIKRLNALSNQGAEEFWTEVRLLSKFRHPNLVSLIGYCNENQEMILVYEYIALGTLANHLYKSSRKESGKSISHLTWAQRLNICLGAAQGLSYLHTGTKQLIIHRDVKSTNILLDENWVAKVSDFGICKCITSQTTTHVTTNVKATRGYWDPEYFKTGQVTRKSDVYAFGVVLLEVLCGRPPLDDRLGEEQASLINWAKKYIEKGKFDRIIDPSLNGETTPHTLKYFAELATKCLHTQPKERPTMSEVVESLEIALVSHERNGRSHGTIPKPFQGIKLLPKGMNHWWRAGKGDLMQPVYHRFPLAEIRAATNDFSNCLLIGEDGSFRWYEGYVMGGAPEMVIKRFESRQCLKEYSAAIRVHSLTPHPNIVSLVGFCDENDELVLVYDYMVNGTLKNHLHECDCDPLFWKKRLEICIDIARGLDYLQTNVEQQFVHCNLNPSSVLLDHNYVGKVAAFEHSVKIRPGMETRGVETNIIDTMGYFGTIGYLDPEYLLTGKVTKKTDVYAFGVMLLEVLCAKTPCFPDRNRCEVLLLDCFRFCIQIGNIDEIIDPYLIGKIAPECFSHYVNIALSCVVKEGIRRPSMNEVLCGLQSSLQMQEAWENSVQMGDELRMADVPQSYDDVISVESEFTIGGQSYLISDLVRPPVPYWEW